MIHLLSNSWAQWILIELGVVLQFAAICALIKQKSAYRMLPREGEEMPHEEEMDELLPQEEDPAHEYPAPTKPRVQEPRPTLKAMNITKTSKVKFKQDLNFVSSVSRPKNSRLP